MCVCGLGCNGRFGIDEVVSITWKKILLEKMPLCYLAHRVEEVADGMIGISRFQAVRC